MTRLLYKILLFLAVALPINGIAQSLEITKAFKMNEFSTVLTTYKNEFGHKIKQGVKDNAFPYAVIEVELVGDEHAVTTAKAKLSLDMGAQYMVEGVTKEYDNKIVFLVSSSVRTIYLTCGDGCEKQAIFEGMQLKPDRIYFGTVSYTPSTTPVLTISQPPKTQYFKFRITPADAVVRVVENGKDELWKVVDGIATKELRYGSYQYTIEADRYHKEVGEFVVSDNANNERRVVLKPQFGYLTIEDNATTRGAYAYATHTETNKIISLGSIPCSEKVLDSGSYMLSVKREMYLDYETSFSITDGDTTILRPNMIANHARLTLIADADAELYNGLTKLGMGGWTGSLECGEYTIEVRKPNHYSSYTKVSVTKQSEGRTIPLTAPVPKVGTLKVNGNPYDAKVFVDGKLYGQTPIVINQLLVGEHEVIIEKNGCRSEQSVTISEGQQQELTYTLIDAIEELQQKNSAKPFPLEPTQIGDIFYMADVYDPYAVEVVEYCKKPHIFIPDSVLYNGHYYKVVSMSDYVRGALSSYKQRGDIVSLTMPTSFHLGLEGDDGVEQYPFDKQKIQTINGIKDGPYFIPCFDYGFSDKNYARGLGQGVDYNLQSARAKAFSAAKIQVQCYLPKHQVWGKQAYTSTGDVSESIFVSSDIPTAIAIESFGTHPLASQLRSNLAKEWEAFCKYELICEHCILNKVSGLYESYITLQLPKTIVQDFIILMEAKKILPKRISKQELSNAFDEFKASKYKEK